MLQMMVFSLPNHFHHDNFQSWLHHTNKKVTAVTESVGLTFYDHFEAVCFKNKSSHKAGHTLCNMWKSFSFGATCCLNHVELCFATLATTLPCVIFVYGLLKGELRHLHSKSCKSATPHVHYDNASARVFTHAQISRLSS